MPKKEVDPQIQGLIDFAKAEENQGLIGIDKYGLPFHKLLRQTRFSRGLKQKEFAQRIGTSHLSISHIEQIKLFPNDRTKKQIADFLGIDSSELFPDWLQIFTGEPSNDESRFELIHEDQIARNELIRQQTAISEFKDPLIDPQKHVENRELRDIFGNLLATLNRPEKITMLYRFGFTGEKEETLQKIGERLGVTRERARQIEAKALNKFRKPARMKFLNGYIEEIKKRPKVSAEKQVTPPIAETPTSPIPVDVVQEEVKRDLLVSERSDMSFAGKLRKSFSQYLQKVSKAYRSLIEKLG